MSKATFLLSQRTRFRIKWALNQGSQFDGSAVQPESSRVKFVQNFGTSGLSGRIARRSRVLDSGEKNTNISQNVKRKASNGIVATNVNISILTLYCAFGVCSPPKIPLDRYFVFSCIFQLHGSSKIPLIYHFVKNDLLYNSTAQSHVTKDAEQDNQTHTSSTKSLL